MRLPKSAHLEHPWTVHRHAGDLEVEDVWELPIHGGEHDFRLVLEHVTSPEVLERCSPLVVKALFAIRWAIGGVLRWDKAPARADMEGSIAERIPSEIRATAGTFERDIAPFAPLYLLEDEFAAETINRTVHGVIHLGWVPDGRGRWRGQIAILVRRRGMLGQLYMKAIAPFRHMLVYPAVLDRLGRSWEIEQHRYRALR